MRSLTLGSLVLKSPFVLSPMEEVSDIGFRHLCFSLGAGITWTEMIRASGVVRKNKATLDLIDTHDPHTLTGLQLFAVNEHELAAALNTIEQLANTTHPHFRNIRAIDLNFGCPSPDVIRIGAGPALLKRTTKMTSLFAALRHWRSTTSLPIGAIGAKIRLGLNQRELEHKVYLRVIEAANAHLDYVTVHARHAKQKSRDAPTWSAIREIKERATIPVIGNGGAITAADAHRMMRETGCDSVMLARGAIKNPWVFRALTGGNETPTLQEIQGAQKQYQTFATRWNTKQKYVAYHKENFARMVKSSHP